MKISGDQIVHNSFLCINVFWLISKEEMPSLKQVLRQFSGRGKKIFLTNGAGKAEYPHAKE